MNYDSTFTIISNTSISIVDLRRHSEIPILEMPTSGGSENGQIGSRYFFDQSIESKNQFRSTLSYYDFRSRKAYFNVISKDNAVLVDFFIDKNGAMHIYFCDVPYPYSGRYEYPNIVHHEIYDTNSFELIRRDLDLTRNGWYPFW